MRLAPEKTRSGSADIARMEWISTAILDSSAYRPEDYQAMLAQPEVEILKPKRTLGTLRNNEI